MPAFAARKKTEQEYNYYMQQVVLRIDKITKKYYNPNQPFAVNDLIYELEKYTQTLEPWARKLARKMINDINRYNIQDWMRTSRRLGQEFKDRYKRGDPIFEAALKLQDDEVNLIKSLPAEAAVRAQKMSQKYLASGMRPEALAEEIMATSTVSKARAKCIARTEMAKASTFLTKSRADSVGVKQFIWHTAGDQIVRDTHAELDGKIFDFDNPPYIEGEGAHLPGDYPNCRCWAEPIITPDQE